MIATNSTSKNADEKTKSQHQASCSRYHGSVSSYDRCATNFGCCSGLDDISTGPGGPLR